MRLKLRVILLVIALIEFMIIIIGAYSISRNPNQSNDLPTVMVINIAGEMVTPGGFGVYEERGQMRTNATSASNVIRMLEYFSKDDNIKAFILEFDAFGGQTAGQEELARYIKQMNKPVVAVVRGSALASGYFVAASTNKIYAEKSSKIGDIAQAFVYINRERNDSEQLCHITCATYKNVTLDNCRGFDSLTFERLRSYVKGEHELLVLRVSQMRNLSMDYVESLSCDAIYDGEQALKLSLIDELGTTNDAVAWLEIRLGIQLNVVNLRNMLRENENQQN